MAKTIGVLTVGGDCAGLNAVVATVVKIAVPMGYKVLGFHKGWEGVLSPPMYRELTLESVRGISHLGGTILGTTNHGRFAGKVGRGDFYEIHPEILKEAKDNLANLGVEGLIVIGGDGTLSAASQLADYGVKMVGVPKSIDNDLANTDMTFGFSTAVAVAVDALDKIHTTASSHGRVFFVECMGRTAGWITLHAGLAGSADAILLPEFTFNPERFLAFLESHVRAKGSAIVAVAEGLSLQLRAYAENAQQEVRLAGASNILMNMVEQKRPGQFEMRNVILGHTQRGGGPNAEDRILAKRYGIAAIEAYHEGKYGQMVCLKNGVIELSPLSHATGDVKRVTETDPVYRVAQRLGIYVD